VTLFEKSPKGEGTEDDGGCGYGWLVGLICFVVCFGCEQERKGCDWMTRMRGRNGNSFLADNDLKMESAMVGEEDGDTFYSLRIDGE